MTFVVSMRLGDPATFEPLRRILARYPTTRFKLDATGDWTPELAAEIEATGALDSIDLKGLYEGTVVDQGADPALYRLRGRRVPARPGSRTRASTARRIRSSSPTATGSPGTRTSMRSPTSRGCRSRRGW